MTVVHCIVLVVLIVLFVVVRAGQDGPDHPAGARRASSSGSASTRTTLPAGLNIVVPFVDRVRYLIDLREQVVSLPAAAGDHRGQPGRLDRHRHLLPGDRPGRGDVRDRQLHPGRSSSSP